MALTTTGWMTNQAKTVMNRVMAHLAMIHQCSSRPQAVPQDSRMPETAAVTLNTVTLVSSNTYIA